MIKSKLSPKKLLLISDDNKRTYSEMIWILLVGLLAALIYYKGIKPMSYWKDLGVNQTKPWPIVGDSWSFLVRVCSFTAHTQLVFNMYPNSR